MQINIFVMYLVDHHTVSGHKILKNRKLATSVCIALYARAVVIISSLFGDYEGQEGDGILTACSQM